MKPEHKKLDSGLNVYLFPFEQSSITQFQLYTPFGGDTLQYRDGDSGTLIDLIPGSAHYFEHVLFIMPPEGLKWRTNIPKTQKNLRDGMTEMKKLGAMVPNAYTWHDITNYWCITRQNQLRILDTMLSFVMQPYLPQDRFNKERGTISDEARRSDNDAGRKLDDIWMKQLFKKHASKKPILGTQEDIQNISLDDLLSMHATFYAPSNMSLVVVGNQSMESIIKVVDAKLAMLGLDKYKTPPKEVIQNEPYGVDIKDNFANPFIRKDVPFPMITGGWKCMLNPLEMNIDEVVEYHVALKLISKALLSRGSIQRELMVKEGMDENYFGGAGIGFRDHGIIYFGGLGLEPEKFRDILIKPVEKIIKNGIPEEEINYARQSILAGHDKNFAGVEGIGSEVIRWGILTKDPRSYFDYIRKVETIKIDDINKHVGRILDLENLSFALALPKND